MNRKLHPTMAAAALLLAALPANADIAFTVTGWLGGVPVPGIQCTNAAGQIQLKGNVHVVRSLASDPLATGRLTAWMDVGYQADGTGLLGGPAYLEAGTWDATGTNFTPSGGVWVMNYRGVAHADNSDEITMTGYGLGGSIEGMRFEYALTRAAGPVFDPAIPYQGSGTIKPAPLVVTTLIDESQAASWPQQGLTPGAALYGTNQQLTFVSPYPASWVSPVRAASVAAGHTLEARVDLVQLKGIGTAALGIYYADGLGYWLEKAGDHISLGKQVAGQGLVTAVLSSESVATGNTDRILSLAVTPSGENVIVTARVLNKADESVIYEKCFVDTPAADPTLTDAQVRAVCGATWYTVVADPAIPPWKTFKSPWLGVFGHTEGTVSEATFDNFQLRDYEVPPLGISRAVQVGWPCPAGVSYSVEGAPTVLGPWLPVSAQTPPGMQQLTLPAAGESEFYRLQLAP